MKVRPIYTNKGLLDIYIKSLIQTMDGENLSGLKIILETCYGSSTTYEKKNSQSLGADVRVINNSKMG